MLLWSKVILRRVSFLCHRSYYLIFIYNFLLLFLDFRLIHAHTLEQQVLSSHQNSNFFLCTLTLDNRFRQHIYLNANKLLSSLQAKSVIYCLELGLLFEILALTPHKLRHIYNSHLLIILELWKTKWGREFYQLSEGGFSDNLWLMRILNA